MPLSLPRFALPLLVSSLVVTADRLETLVDALCGAPKLRLPLAADPDSTAVLEASDDLFGSDWQPLLQLSPGSGHHDWMDPEARSRARRFYRMARVSRPPLEPVPNFRLTDHRGESHELYREGDSRGVVLAFTTAETLAADWARLRPVVQSFASSGLLFWMVDPKDDRSSLAAAAQAAGVTIPVLQDPAHLVSRSYGAGRSGEVAAIDSATATIVYRGAVEDLCEPVPGTVVRQPYLAEALTKFLADQTPEVEFVRPSGPTLGLPSPRVADYRTEVAPILKAKCQTCHKPGDIGTWEMTSHASVAGRSYSVRANLLEGLMPPWHADPAHGQFGNDFSLTAAEQETVVSWLDAGAPRGTGADPLAAVPAPPADWPLGPPDLVLKIQRQNIQATGQMPYAYLFVTNTLRTNAWIRAAAVKPGNRSVVHHALIFQVQPGTLSQMLAQVEAIRGGLSGYFAGFVPGMKQVFYPADTGKQLIARSILVFQMHYTPTGTATTDATEIGLYLRDTPPPAELKTGAGYTTALDIAPGDRRSRVVAERLFTTAVDLRELSPHMHFRGYSMRFDAVLPDGSIQTILNVPKYDFAWQALYRLTQPVRLPAGTRVRISGTFDNSRWNPFNPDPTARVGFGEQTSDEMFIGYMNYTEVR